MDGTSGGAVFFRATRGITARQGVALPLALLVIPAYVFFLIGVRLEVGVHRAKEL
jgi:hypothetical protein